jgi:hypothetical protein
MHMSYRRLQNAITLNIFVSIIFGVMCGLAAQVENAKNAAASNTVLTGSSVIPAPPHLDALKTEVILPADITDLAVGGGGRFLILYLQKLHLLAIFDANAAKVVKYLRVDPEGLLFTAGAEKLIVASTSQGAISRYDLGTFECEVTMPLPLKGKIQAIAMGANSRGPLLMLADNRELARMAYYLIDPSTFAVTCVLSKVRTMFQGYLNLIQIRASADGTVFGMWISNMKSSGMQTIVLEGNDAETYFELKFNGPVIPSFDGRIIFTKQGLFTADTKRIGSADAYAPNNLRVPSYQGCFYLEIDEKGKIAVYPSGEPRALITLPKLADVGDDDYSKYYEDSFTQDKRFHYAPDARLIIAIPRTNDRLILQPFDLLQALKNSNFDYLFATSSPITLAAKNSDYVYQIQVESKRGSAQFTLVNGPKGMSITPTGKLTWITGATQSDATVKVRISDASGQEIFHTFSLRVK